MLMRLVKVFKIQVNGPLPKREERRSTQIKKMTASPRTDITYYGAGVGEGPEHPEKKPNSKPEN